MNEVGLEGLDNGLARQSFCVQLWFLFSGIKAMVTIFGVLPGSLSLKVIEPLRYAGREPTSHGGRDLNMAERILKPFMRKQF